MSQDIPSLASELLLLLLLVLLLLLLLGFARHNVARHIMSCNLQGCC
jgi:hypothetical protein